MRAPAFPRSRTQGNAAWQVIYMDLMTIIMVFFVILWSINQNQGPGISDSVGDQTVQMIDLPGDILFASGESEITPKGAQVFSELFGEDASGKVLDFDTGGLVKRLLVIHGHTDGDGGKERNFDLGFRRATSAYHEIAKYGAEVPHHVVICTHADNSPAREVPVFQGSMTPAERSALQDAKARNRRITIEDKVVNRFSGDSM